MMSDMGELTKFMTFQSIFSLPMLVLFCSLSDVLRKYFPTPIVRKTMYIIPSMIFIAGILDFFADEKNQLIGSKNFQLKRLIDKKYLQTFNLLSKLTSPEIIQK